jgi:hypothetical protein
MRSFRLTTTLAGAALLMMLCATAALAHPHARPHAHRHTSPLGSCRITEVVEPHAITSGESVQVFGQLLCGAGAAEGQTVTIAQSSALSPGYKPAGTATTAAGGFYSLVVSNVTSDSSFSASAMGARSATRNVRVAPTATLAGPPESRPLFTGFRNRVTFAGAVSPEDEGARVVLQREDATSAEVWRAVGSSFVAANGVYSIVHTFSRPGDANLRVVVRRHGRFSVRGVSNTVSYGISQRQNPALTINTTAYAIGYGAPVTLSGVLSGGAHRTVTLQAQSRGGALATVATTTTGPDGQYSFVQTPLASTAYRVSAGPVSSARLFEGVAYLLTTGASATTVQSGQPLTVAGTISPATPEKDVYLERQNASGGGFHVVDVASVGAGGTYSLTDFLFGAGKVVLRVKVHGDPGHQMAASAPFTVEVTPAPPSLLRPVAQPRQPLQGQI